MSQIANKIKNIHDQISAAAESCNRNPESIHLLAVSKTKPVAAIREAFNAGQRRFGENYVQEAVEKIAQLADLAIEWHYIGSIQSNKTRLIAEYFDWAHGVASLKHAQRLSEQRPDFLPPLNICLQINISGEASKSGIAPGDAESLARQICTLPRIKLRGLMVLPAPNADPKKQAFVFAEVKALYDQLNHAGIALDTLSMGMSNDMQAAIQNGATIVRIGTAIFGARD